MLDRAPDHPAARVRAARNVETFELQFQGQGGSGQTGRSSWDRSATLAAGPAADPLPDAVEVTLAVKDAGRFHRLFLVNR